MNELKAPTLADQLAFQHNIDLLLRGELSPEEFSQTRSYGVYDHLLLYHLARHQAPVEWFDELVDVEELLDNGLFSRGLKQLTDQNDLKGWRYVVDRAKDLPPDTQSSCVSDFFMVLKSRKITQDKEYPEILNIILGKDKKLWWADAEDVAIWNVMDFFQHQAFASGEMLLKRMTPKMFEPLSSLLEDKEFTLWEMVWDRADQRQQKTMTQIAYRYSQDHPDDVEVGQMPCVVREHLKQVIRLPKSGTKRKM